MATMMHYGPTGAMFDPLEAPFKDLRVHDMAVSLSRLNRYCGHGKFAYSVAQHCVLLSHVVPRRLAVAALLHDVIETWINDKPHPMKTQDDKDLEERLLRGVALAFRVPYEQFLEVSPWDRRICIDERLALFDNPGVNPDLRLNVPVEPMTAEAAAVAWERRFYELAMSEESDAA